MTLKSALEVNLSIVLWIRALKWSRHARCRYFSVPGIVTCAHAREIPRRGKHARSPWKSSCLTSRLYTCSPWQHRSSFGASVRRTKYRACPKICLLALSASREIHCVLMARPPLIVELMSSKTSPFSVSHACIYSYTFQLILKLDIELLSSQIANHLFAFTMRWNTGYHEIFEWMNFEWWFNYCGNIYFYIIVSYNVILGSSTPPSFVCSDDSEVFPLEVLCNGTAQCSDNSDETNPFCEGIPCSISIRLRLHNHLN